MHFYRKTDSILKKYLIESLLSFFVLIDRFKKCYVFVFTLYPNIEGYKTNPSLATRALFKILKEEIKNNKIDCKCDCLRFFIFGWDF